MPNRLRAAAALLLAITVCLVLVLPQVDLDNGVLRDVQSQVLLTIFMAFIGGLVLFLIPLFSQRWRERLQKDLTALTLALSTSILRC